jgi:hypothetical protein
MTYMHEIGHALGLKHAHETDGYGAIPADHDSCEYTVMTYRSYAGGPATGYTNEQWGFPQTLMQDDIAALQYMYGANFNYNSGATVYTWSQTTGEMFVNGAGQGAPGGNEIFMTVWDGGGADTYDFSGYTLAVQIDLAPGAWTSIIGTGRTIGLGANKFAAGNIANARLYNGDARSLIENATGGAGQDIIQGNTIANVLRGGGGDDTILGNDGNDTLRGDAGNDWLRGGNGTDTAVFTGDILDYTLRYDTSLASYFAADTRGGTADGTDRFATIEQLQFVDRVAAVSGLALDAQNRVTSATGAGWKAVWDPSDAQDWSAYLETYNGSGQRLTQTGTNDNASTWNNFWDPGNAEIWSGYTEFFNPAGVQANQIGTYDTGARWSNNWDANNDQIWSFYSEHFNTAGIQANQIGTYDSGARWSNNWDANNDQIWSFYSEYFNTAGVQANQIGTYDSGARWSNNWDANNDQNWSYYSEYFNTNGVQANQIGTYDSGARWSNNWDADNNQNWSYYSEYFLANGNKANQIGVYDNGAQWKNYWDADGTHAWQSYSESWNAAGEIVNRVTTFDDGHQTTDWFI